MAATEDSVSIRDPAEPIASLDVLRVDPVAIQDVAEMNDFVTVRDDRGSTNEFEVLRVNIKNEEDARTWLTRYSTRTNTSWILAHGTVTTQCLRMVFHKRWCCQHAKRYKEGSRHCTNCPAFVDIKIKKNNKNTQRNDAFLRRDVPLAGVIKLRADHNHNISCADGLRLLRSTPATKEAYFNYFDDGMTPAEAMALHGEKLAVEEDGLQQLANGALNPSANTVYYWNRLWRQHHFGGRVDPVTKLTEKTPKYLEEGTAVATFKSDDGSCWAALVVTPIMARTQSLEASRELIFLDSTSSCDDGQSTTTVLLAATKAGAVPIAVIVHSSQSTEGYTAAFSLLQRHYPLCFGGVHAPQAFMTDNSAAEKAALRATWPESRQLLCHFHVAQAEWRWLQASRNNISRDNRRPLMTAFQKIMYAETEAELEAAVLALQEQPQKDYVTRVETFLEKKEEWVLLFRATLTTRGHNTNNFSEASIRVLKDIILGRHKTYNAVALVDMVVSVWEKYFTTRILKHAHNRVPTHRLLFERLLSRMPQDRAMSIRPIDENLYVVPSAKDGTSYEVDQDVGTCTCKAGQQGAFCKHQAAVLQCYGGSFPNAPALTTEDRYRLGWLAVGDVCPPASFFGSFNEADPVDTQDVPACPSTCQSPGPSSVYPQDAVSSSPSIQEQPRRDGAEIARALQQQVWRHFLLSEDNPNYVTQMQRLLTHMSKAHNGSQVMADILATNAAFGRARRCGGRIKVQPTAISRRREGISRGSKRVPAGRPPKQAMSKKAKREHTLHLSVKSGVPHAKMH